MQVARRGFARSATESRRVEALLSQAAADSLRIWTHIQASQGAYFNQSDTIKLHSKYKDAALHLTVVDGIINVVNPELPVLQRNANAAKNMLLDILKRSGLPDGLDMVWNMHDAPIVIEEAESYHQPPMFSFCSRHGFADVAITALDFAHVTFDMADLLLAHPWSSRSEVAFWRGSPTGAMYTLDNWRAMPRPQLVNLSQHNSAVLDAKFYGCWQCEVGVWEEIVAELGAADGGNPPGQEVLAERKYLVDLDGNGWSSRLLGQLALGCVIFKVEPLYYEFFWSLLIPYVHYVPIRRDMSDLVSQIEYARAHDEEMQAIAMAARDFLRSMAGRVWQRHLHNLLNGYHNLFIPPLSDTLSTEHV